MPIEARAIMPAATLLEVPALQCMSRFPDPAHDWANEINSEMFSADAARPNSLVYPTSSNARRKIFDALIRGNATSSLVPKIEIA